LKEAEQMSAVEDKIIERVHELPPDRQEEVLRFVESLTMTPRKSLLEEIREIYKDVPDAEWERLPNDGSENLDHYLYGAPKK
jgi:hypothetical protein